MCSWKQDWWPKVMDQMEGATRHLAPDYDTGEMSIQKIAAKIKGERRVMLASFKVSDDYKTMKPGELYFYNSNNAKKNPNKVTFSHCVLVVGYGLQEGDYLVILDSHGSEFWEGGFGRVYLEDILSMAGVEL
ncbi:hypothetical protein E2562_026596 [Oryza meyeriana var. granulata]|uniref:Peptidase C1A papain C-terminal domain-containing protein n=1 Tax=Oryza meyeriana var. granulata TaxID=110450 RepID=A0A6G1CT62_9ORYZ|nr:hypothetical protein E2562_026596 [Oryza meyeriana var. granulata]